MEFTEQLAQDLSLPHIDVYRQYADGEHYGYRAQAQEGYVFYDPAVDYISVDDRTGEETLVRYYYTNRHFPATYDMTTLGLIAVPRGSVNEDDIFGDNNAPEVM